MPENTSITITAAHTRWVSTPYASHITQAEPPTRSPGQCPPARRSWSFDKTSSRGSRAPSLVQPQTQHQDRQEAGLGQCQAELSALPELVRVGRGAGEIQPEIAWLRIER